MYDSNLTLIFKISKRPFVQTLILCTLSLWYFPSILNIAKLERKVKVPNGGTFLSVRLENDNAIGHLINLAPFILEESDIKLPWI
jgi:hypothetical protein